jgi:hypothetical protein
MVRIKWPRGKSAEADVHRSTETNAPAKRHSEGKQQIGNAPFVIG